MYSNFEYNFCYKVKPRFSDIDGYGIAHHSKFFCWFEEARFYFLDTILKVSKEDYIDMRALITSLKAEFKKSIVFQDSYIILVGVKWNQVKPLIKFTYQIMDLDQKIIYAKAETDHIFINKSGELLLEIPNYISEKFNMLIKE